MIETLQFGGGILNIKPLFDDASFEDFGYCHDVVLQMEYLQEFQQKYMKGIGSNVIKVKSPSGSFESVKMNGSFICESFTRARLQSLWFRGVISDAGTELLQTSTLVPIISALKFLSVSDSGGPIECLKIPKISLSVDERAMMGYEWRNLKFSFEVHVEEGFIPTLRVQEEGEDLANFCD